MYYLYGDAAPGCEDSEVLDQLSGTLRERFHIDGVFLNNMRPVAGGYFSGQRECAAEIAAIRGNVDASEMTWKSVRYQIDRRDAPSPPAVAVTLGGDVPFTKPVPSFWDRLSGG